MKFLLWNEKALKNGFYLDYFFKNIIFYIFKSMLGNNFIYILDKYITEKIFFFIKNFSVYIASQLNILKLLSFSQILKLTLIMVIQLTLLLCL